MKRTYNFENQENLSELSDIQSKKKSEKKQIRVFNDQLVSASTYNDLDNIKKVLEKYKQKLIKKFGEEKGTEVFRVKVLHNGKYTEEHFIKSMYNCIHYSIHYGAMGFSVADYFYNPNILLKSDEGMEMFDTIFQAINQNMNLPPALIQTILLFHRRNVIKKKVMVKASMDWKKLAGRNAQIEYISKSIDKHIKLNQRFKSTMSEINGLMKKKNKNQNININLPKKIVKGAIYTVGGQATQMKVEDFTKKVETKLENIKEGVFSKLNSLKSKLFNKNRPQ